MVYERNREKSEKITKGNKVYLFFDKAVKEPEEELRNGKEVGLWQYWHESGEKSLR